MAEPAPKVSVVIPAYNRAATLRRAMDSVLSQTLSDLELIVVDDASTDDTVSVVASTADPRVRVLRHDTNRRAAAARNTGIRAARGEYVAFLDSDDEWLPEKLERQVAFLDTADPQVRASVTAFFLEYQGQTLLHVPRLLSHRRMLEGCDTGPGTTLMVRRDVFAAVGLNDEGLYRYEDWDWLLNYAERFQLACLDQPLARVHRDSGHPAGAPMETATLRLLERHAERIHAYGPRHARKVSGLRWWELAAFFFRDRDFAKGTRYLMKALATWPFVHPGRYVNMVEGIFDIPFKVFLWRAGIRGPGGNSRGEAADE